MDVNYVLARAESLCLLLQQTEDLPDHIRDLIGEPSDIDGSGQGVDSSSQENGDISDRQDVPENSGASVDGSLNDDAVVELKENTHSVF